MAGLEGKAAPDFALAGSDGREHRLADYAGRILVIYFYPKDNTPGCTKEACGFRDLGGDFAALDVTVLGISRDSLESHDRFIRAFGLPFVLLTDPQGAMMRAYGAWGEKLMYGKPVTGTIRSTLVVGPNGIVRRHWTQVKKAESHPAEVLAYLREVGG